MVLRSVLYKLIQEADTSNSDQHLETVIVEPVYAQR